MAQFGLFFNLPSPSPVWDWVAVFVIVLRAEIRALARAGREY
jgi:hypothetical protein